MVGAGEVGDDEGMDVPIEEAGEEGCDVGVDVWLVLLGKGDEHVHAIHLKAVGFASGSLPDGCDDVSWELEVWGGRSRRGSGRTVGCLGRPEGRRNGRGV